MAIKAVVFDIGEVLEHTPRTGWEAKWDARLNLQPGELTERIRDIWAEGSCGRITLEEVEKRVGEVVGMPQAQVEEMMRDFWEEYVGTLNTELAAYFASLRPRYKTAILSNSFVGATEREQELYGFAEMCDLVIYSHEVGCRKPEPEIFELMCERLGAQPEEIVFLDDVEENVSAAREFGINAILCKNTAQAIADVEACFIANGQTA